MKAARFEFQQRIDQLLTLVQLTACKLNSPHLVPCHISLSLSLSLTTNRTHLCVLLCSSSKFYLHSSVYHRERRPFRGLHVPRGGFYIADDNWVVLLLLLLMAAKKAFEGFSKGLREEVHRWGAMKQTGVSLRYMMEFGSRPTPRNLLISAQFLQKELPIRIARRAIELESLPYGLSKKPAVLKVRDWYLDSFRDIRSFPDIKDNNDELGFTKMIKMIKVRHNNVVPMMALGVQQLKKDLDPKIDYNDLDEIHQFLDRFYMSRIGIRMLIGQHVALHDPNPAPNCVGYIHTKMSPVEVARNASEDARSICLREYGCAPNINIYGDPEFTFPYVPTHLHLMVFELVKNSLRAVQERFMDSDKIAPPIRIIVADGLEDVTIKVSDEGGGIARSGLPRIFTYLYSTARNPLDEQSDADVETATTMAGYGYGLPISRLYARYFGGDLQIISMEGYGTDAYLHLSRLGDSQEPLP